jgi:hypothetical protein
MYFHANRQPEFTKPRISSYRRREVISKIFLQESLVDMASL